VSGVKPTIISLRGLPGDLQDVVEIETAARALDPHMIPHSWGPEDYRRLIKGTGRRRPGGASAVTIQGRTLGVLGFKLRSRTSVEILHVVTHPEFRRRGLGSYLLDHFTAAARAQGRVPFCHVPERLLGLQLFLRDRRFHCYQTKPHYFGPDEAAYYMGHRPV
jgi:GNAT superfamily N-acetyltransferase